MQGGINATTPALRRGLRGQSSACGPADVASHARTWLHVPEVPGPAPISLSLHVISLSAKYLNALLLFGRSSPAENGDTWDLLNSCSNSIFHVGEVPRLPVRPWFSRHTEQGLESVQAAVQPDWERHRRCAPMSFAYKLKSIER